MYLAQCTSAIGPRSYGHMQAALITNHCLLAMDDSYMHTMVQA